MSSPSVAASSENEVLETFSTFEVSELESLSKFKHSDLRTDEKPDDAQSVDRIVGPEAENVKQDEPSGGMRNYLVILEPLCTRVLETCLHQEREYSTMPTR